MTEKFNEYELPAPTFDHDQVQQGVGEVGQSIEAKDSDEMQTLALSYLLSNHQKAQLLNYWSESNQHIHQRINQVAAIIAVKRSIKASEIGEICGLSAAHVNRFVRRLHAGPNGLQPDSRFNTSENDPSWLVRRVKRRDDPPHIYYPIGWATTLPYIVPTSALDWVVENPSLFTLFDLYYEQYKCCQ